MSTIKNLFINLLAIQLIVLVHEAGHFFACNIFSIPTHTFSIGFGPALLKTKIGQTTFQLALLPLGGYVSMNVNKLNQAPYWQKMIVTLSGIINNILLTIIILITLAALFRSPIIIQARNSLTSSVSSLFSSLLRGSLFFGSPRVERYRYFGHALQQEGIIFNGLTQFLLIVATFSLEIGLFNLLPIPLLDGSQALQYTVEALPFTSFLPQPFLHLLYLLVVIGLILLLNRWSKK